MDRTIASFVPPHCPRSRCRYHWNTAGWRWKHHGSYTRQASPTEIPRFRCCHCGATFSSQTFHTTYYLKRPELQVPLLYRLDAGSGYRQMAREMRCSHSTLVHQAARLGRHALLFMSTHRPRGPLLEPLVIDGFESFAYSQYHPMHLNLGIGADTGFHYGFTHSPLRRKGTMRPEQRMHRDTIEATLGRPDPKAVEKGMAETIRMSAPTPQWLDIRSDGHPAYERSFRRLAGYRITHKATPSTDPRTPTNDLFFVNRRDMMLRHNGANHRRETIAFSKRDQGVVDRAAIHLMLANYWAPSSVNHDRSTPAMKLGLFETPLSPQALLGRRLFVTKTTITEEWRRYYFGLVDTAEIENPKRHTLKLAA